jgi:hypothetical protein
VKAEDRIVEAIEAARARGIHIIRGPVFDWTTPGNWRAPRRELPYACNAVGAILLFLGKEQMVSPDVYTGFAPGWHKLIEDHLGVTDFWLWRFGQGFNGGYQITLTVEGKNGKDKILKDDVSALGITVRKRFRVS